MIGRLLYKPSEDKREVLLFLKGVAEVASLRCSNWCNLFSQKGILQYLATNRASFWPRDFCRQTPSDGMRFDQRCQYRYGRHSQHCVERSHGDSTKKRCSWTSRWTRILWQPVTISQCVGRMWKVTSCVDYSTWIFQSNRLFKTMNSNRICRSAGMAYRFLNVAYLKMLLGLEKGVDFWVQVPERFLKNRLVFFASE